VFECRATWAEDISYSVEAFLWWNYLLYFKTTYNPCSEYNEYEEYEIKAIVSRQVEAKTGISKMIGQVPTFLIGKTQLSTSYPYFRTPR
jgi:hypothetical protein